MASIINANTSGGLISTGDTSGQLQLQTAGTTALTVTSAQNVGIGTTSPVTKVHAYSSTTMAQLTVDGAGAIKTGINFASSGTTYGQIYFDNTSPYDMSVFQQYSTGSLRFGTNNTEQMRLDSSGNLGLGLTPNTWNTGGGKTLQLTSGALTAYSTDNIQMVQNLYYNSGWIYKTSNYGTIYNQSLGQHTWFTAPSGTAGNTPTLTQVMTLDPSGNLLVGNSTPQGAAGPRLYIVSTNNTSGDLGIYSQLGANCSNTSSVAFSASITGVGNKFYVYGNGNVVNTNNSYGAISDVKFKENIVDATPKLNDVLNLKVRNFNLKTEPENKQIGFIAQEFEEVFPSMIDVSPDTDTDGKFLETTHKSIKLSVLVPILVKSIQELSTQLTELKAEVATLRGA